ncbi:type II secretion system protein J [Glaciimonas sp. PCH181]|uniref:PulJ/GspJ family protein n=1 Tax=Glaciimonas sp. PCH181 TaxID=2133943 RepID=UPI000D3B2A82|nr:prepilin-type N-terminal cleavage/methylation domain-containing protein [Glaciimonas sp. PCH181]PUA19104.1 type II secretory pathway component PulJ [Glaciimonas sp. PCH181]
MARKLADSPLLYTVVKRCSGGFTLVEMIVAIGILALVAVLGWRGLDGIVRARVALTAELEQTRGMQLTFAQLQSDTAQLAPAALIGARPALAATANGLTMIRLVLADQQPTRLEVVSYRLRNGVLSRQESPSTRALPDLDAAWQAAVSDTNNAAAGLQPIVLQSDIASMQIRVWDQIGQIWHGADGAAAAGSANWAGLEMGLQLRGHDGRAVKTFFLGAT